MTQHLSSAVDGKGRFATLTFERDVAAPAGGAVGGMDGSGRARGLGCAIARGHRGVSRGRD